MSDPIVVVDHNNVGSTVQGFVLQALSWLAFGFFMGAGFYFARVACHKIVS